MSIPHKDFRTQWKVLQTDVKQQWKLNMKFWGKWTVSDKFNLLEQVSCQKKFEYYFKGRMWISPESN